MEKSEKVIKYYAKRYDEKYVKQYSLKTEQECKEQLVNKDYLTRNDFIKIGLWKSKRPKRHYESKENSDSFVQEVSAFAFKSEHEKIKIEALTLIKGCRYPVASVILHFKYPDLYPIIDFRAVWSLWRIEQTTQGCNFDFWWKYVEEIRSLSESLKIDIRTIDKALWCYSKENQPKKNKAS